LRQQLTIPRPASVLHVNVEKIVNIALQQAGDPTAARAVTTLGLDAVNSFSTVSGLDENGCVTRSLLTVDGPGRGMLSWIDTAPLSGDDLKVIGGKSPVAISFKLDPAALFDLWFGLAGEIEPRAALAMKNGLGQFEQQVGFKVREDLLASLGDTYRVFAQPGPQSLITGWTIAVKVRDRKKLEQIQQTLIGMAKQMLQQAGPGAPTFQSKEVNGKTVHTLSFGPNIPAAPSWCITDTNLFVTVTPQGLEPLLGGAVAGPSLADAPEVNQLFGNNERNLALAYVDTKQLVQTLLPMAKMMLQTMPLPPGIKMDTKNLPPASAFLPHLQPTVAALRRTDQGVEFVSHQTMPGGNVGASAPVMVALLLPAVQAAREAARRTQGGNNLKQIALAMHNFHDTYRAFPAGYSADKDGKPLLSWRVHILPFIEQQDLYEQFHLDEPWDSPHNKTLIAQMPEIYRAPGSSSAEPGTTNYLGVGGADGIFVRPKNGDRMGTGIRQITDGTSNTMMVIEVPDKSAVIWTKPGDFGPNKDNPLKGLLGLHPGGFQAALADGSVRFIAETIDVTVLKALFTKAGGEAVRLP